jgi:hypothetical protein
MIFQISVKISYYYYVFCFSSLAWQSRWKKAIFGDGGCYRSMLREFTGHKEYKPVKKSLMIAVS